MFVCNVCNIHFCMTKYVSFNMAMYGLCFMGVCTFIVFIGDRVRFSEVSSDGYGYICECE